MLRHAAFAAFRAQRAHSLVEPCSACWAKQIIENLTACSTSRSALQRDAGLSRMFTKLAEVDDEDFPTSTHPRVQKLAEEIMHLNLLEIADLTEILQKRLNIQSPVFGGMPMGGAMPGAAAPAAPQTEAESAPAEKVPEKTDFDVKLDGFDAATKIKVIKEVRVITELGLKEAKELVEKSPVVIKAGLKKEEAEELKKKLEAVGAKISLE